MKLLFSLAAGILLLNVHAQSIVLDDIDPEEMTSSGFNLSSNSTVKLEGTGALFYEDWKAIIYYGWIIDAESREVVWHMFDEIKDEDSRDLQGQIDFNLDVDLDAGNYEAYFAAAHSSGNDWNNWGNSWAVQNFNDVVDKIFDSRDRRKFRTGFADDFYMKVTSSNLKSVSMDKLLSEKLSASVVSFSRVGDDASLKKGFSLSRETDLQVYAVGEIEKSETYDYFWIKDVSTMETVFEMNYRNTDFAGGAKKNLKFQDVITLEAGSYMASYVTDDSHSYEKWNSLPPDDPQFWGAAIWPASENDRRNVIPYKEPKTIAPIAQITKVRDDEMLSKGITLLRNMDVRVLSLGEGTDDSMADYGWIMNANTREKVWKMKYHRSDHAGGARKNRKVSDVINLPKGDYIVYYTTDDSHAYNDWNDTRPHEENMWGISLWATNEGDLKSVKAFSPSGFKSENALVEITMVRDYENIRESFTLSSDSYVRVLALGEGDSGEMYDYGTIRDDSGRIVWEMEYRNSDYAGGASKNREFNEKVFLKAGQYRVTYRTDDSHSYGDWNSSPPPNEEMWGIVVLKE